MPQREHLGLILVLLVSCSVAVGGAPQQAPAPAGGGVQASGPAFHVVRSISGTKGSVQGSRFIMEDPRTIFYLPQDKQVIVYFEWEGPLGPHKFEGYWKNPDGKISAISDFSFEAKDKRFGGYWTLSLSETMQTGLWTLEARVDGEITGTHAFQILSREKPAEAAPAPRELSSAEIYKLAGSATLSIDRLDNHGQRFGRGSGFFLGENVAATAFQNIDGASALRITLADGRRAESNTVLAWNRRQDWALLEVAVPGAPHLIRAGKDSGAVGDRVFLLDLSSEGVKTLTETEVIGVQEYPGSGTRLAISQTPSSGSIGGPLLDVYGRVLGVLGGSLLPGSSTLQGVRFIYSVNMKLLNISTKVMGVPIDLVSMTTPGQATLAELAASGQFTFPLTQNQEVISGELCKHMDRKAPNLHCADQSNEFPRSQKEMYALITWAPKSKRKAQAFYEVFDLENHKLAQGQPVRLDLQPNSMRTVDSAISVANLALGVYRVDVLLDGEPAWRTFFRITE